MEKFNIFWQILAQGKSFKTIVVFQMSHLISKINIIPKRNFTNKKKYKESAFKIYVQVAHDISNN